MAVDPSLVERIRPLLAEHEPVDERRMFGGLAFLVHGHMAVCVSGQGGLMVRVRDDERDALLALDGAGEMVMSGRPSRTWLRVQGPVLDDDAVLAEWVERGLEVIDDLPPKA
ncbi:TfoX/Sxy family protein [Agrococcus sp. SGAir0287]|uniref:TfoX/Sxy family protein n=1 Tax=Agrococcus sp. SGAir0287 TaxID=2070347 RepID=UPI0010CCEB97|nr:TfoX/Sxy family protein [Agrococcus sp. SGAir0287]QCR20395.1 RNA methyltransferase [Agrococcus sp. SGAir0287]